MYVNLCKINKIYPLLHKIPLYHHIYKVDQLSRYNDLAKNNNIFIKIIHFINQKDTLNIR